MQLLSYHVAGPVQQNNFDDDEHSMLPPISEPAAAAWGLCQ